MTYTSLSIKQEEREEIKKKFDEHGTDTNRIGKFVLACVQQATEGEVTVETETETQLNEIHESVKENAELLSKLSSGSTNPSGTGMMESTEKTLSTIEMELTKLQKQITESNIDIEETDEGAANSESDSTSESQLTDISDRVETLESSVHEVTVTVQNIERTLDEVTGQR